MFSADSCFLAPPIRILPSFVQKIIFTKIINHKDLLYRFHAIFKVFERFIDKFFSSGSRVSKLLCPDPDPRCVVADLRIMPLVWTGGSQET